MYCVISFGLNVSDAEFIRTLDLVLGKDLLKKLIVYVNDISVTGKSSKDHANLLGKMWSRLRDEECHSN